MFAMVEPHSLPELELAASSKVLGKNTFWKQTTLWSKLTEKTSFLGLGTLARMLAIMIVCWKEGLPSVEVLHHKPKFPLRILHSNL